MPGLWFNVFSGSHGLWHERIVVLVEQGISGGRKKNPYFGKVVLVLVDN